MRYFNPRSPRGGATHRPLLLLHIGRFQSTLPTRGSDGTSKESLAALCISIHAPHEGERLRLHLPSRQHPRDFNPRSPRGGATCAWHYRLFRRMISIHAPHEGERPAYNCLSSSRPYFNPRSPRGGATHFLRSARRQPCDFNPRSPRGGATFCHDL